MGIKIDNSNAVGKTNATNGDVAPKLKKNQNNPQQDAVRDGDAVELSGSVRGRAHIDDPSLLPETSIESREDARLAVRSLSDDLLENMQQAKMAQANLNPSAVGGFVG